MGSETKQSPGSGPQAPGGATGTGIAPGSTGSSAPTRYADWIALGVIATLCVLSSLALKPLGVLQSPRRRSGDGSQDEHQDVPGEVREQWRREMTREVAQGHPNTGRNTVQRRPAGASRARAAAEHRATRRCQPSAKVRHADEANRRVAHARATPQQRSQGPSTGTRKPALVTLEAARRALRFPLRPRGNAPPTRGIRAR